MNRLVALIACLLSIAAATAACGETEEQPSRNSLGDTGTMVAPSPTLTEAASSEETPWKLIITRADGTIEVIGSLDQPIVCDSDEEPRILYFCGSNWQEGQPLPIAWDYKHVNLDGGDTYTIEGPHTPTPVPHDGTPTPTVIGPNR